MSQLHHITSDVNKGRLSSGRCQSASLGVVFVTSKQSGNGERQLNAKSPHVIAVPDTNSPQALYVLYLETNF